MNQPQVPTWRDNPEFMNNPTIQNLGQECRWTISSMQPIQTKNLKTGKPYVLPEKSPIDVRELVRAPNFRGAFEISEQCLMTLDELNHHFPTATNNAFYLSAQIDEVMVLDIEPTCPADVRDELLALPALYREISMSGSGYHLVMPLPTNFSRFPSATGKTKLQEEHRWYEILIDHWVTFTRNVVPDPVHTLPQSSKTWEQVYAELAAKAVESARTDVHVDEEMPDLPRFDFIMKIMLQLPYTKTIADFHGDRSRWEYGAMGHMYNKLSTLLMADLLVDERDWSDSDRVWLLYQAAVRFLPARDKHHEKRSGMPYLRYVATTMVAQRSHPDGQPNQGG